MNLPLTEGQDCWNPAAGLARSVGHGAGPAWMLALLTLSSNRWPFLTGVVVLLACGWTFRPPFLLLRPVALVGGAWLLSLALAGSIVLFVDPAFHRRDGLMFFCMLPLLALASGGVSREAVLNGGLAFAGLQSGLAFLSVVADFAGQRNALTGFTFLPDEGPSSLNYCGLYLAHNAAGSVQALCCLMALTLAALGREPGQRRLWGILAIVLLWGVILSKSRGALISLVGGAAVLAWISWKQNSITRRGWAVAGVAVLTTCLLFGGQILQRMGQFREPGGTHSFRLDQWKRAVEEWSWSPLVGIGMGRYNDEGRTFSGIKGLVFVATDGRDVNEASHAHNSYIHFLAEGGLVGFGVTLAFWACLAWKLRKSREPLKIAAFLGILFLFAISMTEHYMGGGAMLILLSCLVGAAWSLPEPVEPVKIDPS